MRLSTQASRKLYETGTEKNPLSDAVVGYPMLEFSTIYHFLEQVQVWLYWQLEETLTACTSIFRVVRDCSLLAHYTFKHYSFISTTLTMADVRTEYQRAKSSGKSRRSQRESSIARSSNQMPQSALRSGKYDTSNSKLNELKFDLSEIHDIYGYDATLYYVLSISRNASAREIKAAYLNRGREILLAGRNSSQPSVSDRSRKEFQAVSLAYEILSKEDLRALYDGRCSVARKNCVQWSKVVQEKVIKDAHPNEHSHRRYSKRAPPVYTDDSCTELDDEFDELMYYCNDNGGVNFIELAELQGLVDTFNTSMKMKRVHLLESCDTKLESERQPSEETAAREGGDQRQPSAQSEDNGVVQAHNEDTYNFVCDTAEETIFPVKGDVSQEEMDLEGSTMAIGVAATALAVALVQAEAETADLSNAGCFSCGELEVLTNGDNDNDMIEPRSIQEEPHTAESANETSNCEAEEKTTNSKPTQTMKLRTAMASRRESKSLLNTNAVEKPTDEVTSDEVAAGATVTSTGWFACCGASEAIANDDDDDEKIQGDNTVGNEETAEATNDNDTDAAVDVNSTTAVENTTNKKVMPSMKLRKAMASRKKSKSLLETEDQEPSASEVTAVAAGTSAGWFAFCGASEVIANDNDHDDGEEVVSNMADNKETHLGERTEEKSVAEEDIDGDAEAKTRNIKDRSSTKLRKAMASRKKSKSLLETEDLEPSAEVVTDTSAGWFTCCGASEATANDNDDDEMTVSHMNKINAANVELVGEKSVADKDTDGDAEEQTTKSKTRPSTKLRKAMASRKKSKSLHQEPSTEVVTTTTGVSAGWFACCGVSEALANDDVSEMTPDNITDDKMEATSTTWVEEKNVADEDCGGDAERETGNKKPNPSKKLLKTVSIRTKSKNNENKQSEDARAQQDRLEEEEMASSSFFFCCGASEAIPDKEEEMSTTEVKASTQKRLSNSARKLRNQMSARKMKIKPLMDMDEQDTSDVDNEHIPTKAEKRTKRNLKISMMKKNFSKSKNNQV
eukprot:scaffold11839_cov143-Skeletonema_dohrnii-CCMP3373.AAC.1